jgi:futalosine hydrolase
VSSALGGRPLIVCAAEAEGHGLADAVLGVGKAAAASRATELVLRTPPAWLLLIGMCGAYPPIRGGAPVLSVGELCLVSEDWLADEGVALPGGAFRGIATLGLGSEGPFAADADRTRLIAGELGAHIVVGATVSTCSGSDPQSALLAGRNGGAARVETMEGAAVLQVCQRFGVSAVQLRCVSNRTGDRATAGWDLPRAVARLHEAVRALSRAHGWGIP